MAFISDLNPAIPTDDDLLDSLDIEITGIKQTLQDQFPNFNAAAVNATPAELNLLVGVPADLEHMGNKDSAGGYCPLDGSSLVPLANLPDTLTGKDADTVDGLHANVFAQLTGAMFTGGVTLTSGDFTVDTGNLVALAGVFRANQQGNAFESLENALIGQIGTAGGAAYDVLGAQRGDTGSAGATNVPMVNMQHIFRPNGGAATGFGYLFQATRYGSPAANDGDLNAYYNLVGFTRSHATSNGASGGHDIVGVAGIAKSEVGSTCRAYGLFGDAAVYNTSGRGVACEVDVRNITNQTAPDDLTFGGATLGLAIAGRVDTTAAPNSLYNTYGILFQGASDAGFKRGIHFTATSVAPNGIGIDFSAITSTGVKPILLKNNSGVYQKNSGGTDVQTLNLDASDILSIKSGGDILFKDSSATLGVWKGSNKHLVVGGTSDDGTNMLQVGGAASISGDLSIVGGKVIGQSSGQAFESLENALGASLPAENANEFVVIGMQRGTSGVAAAPHVPFCNFQQNIRPNQAAPNTGYGYLFQTHRYGSPSAGDGNLQALYNVTSLVRSYSNSTGANNAHDIVGVAGIAKAEVGSTCRAYGLYGDAAVYNYESLAVSSELDVRNTTGGEAPDLLGVNGASIGLAIAGLVGTGLAPGSLYNTYGLLFQAKIDAGFKRGITFDPTSIAPNGVVIDFTRLTNTGVVPLLFKNDAGLSMKDVGGTPIEVLKLNPSNNLVLRTRSEIRFSEENVPSTMGTWIGSNKHLVVGSSTGDGVNMLQVHGPIATVGSFPLKVNSVQVVGVRRTGWSAATGTATRTTFATSTVTTAQLAQRVKALIDDLITHGMIGA